MRSKIKQSIIAPYGWLEAMDWYWLCVSEGLTAQEIRQVMNRPSYEVRK